MAYIKLSSENLMYWASFRRVLVGLLDRPGYTRRLIADAVGASEQAVGAWVSGKSKPSADNLLRLSDHLGISLDKLMGRVTPGTEALREVTTRVRPILEALECMIPEAGSAGATKPAAPGKKKRSKSTKTKKQ